MSASERSLKNRSEWLDGNGYPTQDALEVIAYWPNPDGFEECLDFVAMLWAYPDYVTKSTEDGAIMYHFATAGWSGNEDLIGALESNLLLRAMCWVYSARGGKHVYEVESVKEEKAD